MHDKTNCGILMKQIVDRIAKESNNELQENDLTLSQIRYLDFIYENANEKVPLKEIEAHFKVAQPTVAGIMARLVKKGLVGMEQSNWNASAKTVSLTEKGAAVYLKSGKSRGDTEARILHCLTEEEREAFYQMLVKINADMKNA